MRQSACLLSAVLLSTLLLTCTLSAGCGGGGGSSDLAVGTVSLLNQTDLGSAPLVVTEFYMAPVGESNPGANLLPLSVQPGSVVIVGLFPAGIYNAVAVLESGGQINYPPATVVAGQPTNFVIP